LIPKAVTTEYFLTYGS